MATFTHTPAGTWKAEIRIKQSTRIHRITRTFDTKRQAQAWATESEASIRMAASTGRNLPTNISLGEALNLWFEDIERYIADDSQRGAPHRPRIAKRLKKDQSRKRIWLRHPYSKLPLRDIGAVQLEAYIDERRDEDVAEQTVRNDLYLLSSLIEHAQTATREDGPKGWNWKIDNPVKAACQARRLGYSKHRDRRLTSDEYSALIALFKRMRAHQIAAEDTGSKEPFELRIAGRAPLVIGPNKALAYIPAAFLAAIESAMRREKMFDMEWSWIDWPGDIVIPDQMRGPSNKQVPSRLAASPNLQRILLTLNGVDGSGVRIPRIGDALKQKVFGPLTADYAYRLLKRACNALGIEDLHWHDLRHEACSRLADLGWTTIQIQRVSGHKTLQSLERYTHVSTASVHAQFAADEVRRKMLIASTALPSNILTIPTIQSLRIVA